jgi:hypothetical protein
LLAFGQGEQGDTVERSVPSRLNSSTNSADYVIIAYHDFIPAVQPLVKLRQSQGMAVSVVDVDSVFNEFSYGIHDPQAIKDFLRYAQTHWKKRRITYCSWERAASIPETIQVWDQRIWFQPG